MTKIKKPTRLQSPPFQWVINVGVSLLLVTLSGCAAWQAKQEGTDLIAKGQSEAGIEKLTQASRIDPNNVDYRQLLIRERQAFNDSLVTQIRNAIVGSQFEKATLLLTRLTNADVNHPRAADLQIDLQRAIRLKTALQNAASAIDQRKFGIAEDLIAAAHKDEPDNKQARELLARLATLRASNQDASTPSKKSSKKPISVSFRDASLSQVFDALRQAAQINFIFDRDVRTESKVTVSVMNKPVDEVLSALATSQKLSIRQLDEDTVFIFPNTPEKQRDYQEQLIKIFYLTNADPNKIADLVRRFTQAKEAFVDERLNALVIKDTSEGIELVERLLASLDIAEPEVMLELEVLEVSTNRLLDLGIRWPDSISAGLQAPGGAPPGQLTLSQLRSAGSALVQVQIPNPLITASAKQSDGEVTVLANPRVRIRNRQTAKVLVGERVPIITTTTTANVGASESVSYLDVGLKLELEPTVLLDNDVSMKVALEVSSISGEVVRPSGLQAFRLGTRNASTSLRVKDGETQILAGLIQRDERVAANRVPGIGSLPLIGRLFSRSADSDSRTEIVLLITPRIVRNIVVPDPSRTVMKAPNDNSTASSTSNTAPIRVTPQNALPTQPVRPLGAVVPPAPPQRQPTPANPVPSSTFTNPPIVPTSPPN